VHPTDKDTGIIPEEASLGYNIRLENVYFNYQMRPDNTVLQGLNLDVPAGSVCALVGRSGGGKSTIVHLILRFYDPHKGKLFLDDYPINELDSRWYRSNIGLVAQDSPLFNLSVEENITYGCNEPYTREQLYDAARKACAHDFIMELDEGYATRVGERGTRLSGSQKQRIAIARVFFRRPHILLLDEATSALDAESEAQVQEALDNLIRDVERKCTVIIVAHRLSTVMHADKICVIQGGCIVEQGTHPQLMASEGIYAMLVEKQIAKAKDQITESNIAVATVLED